MDGHELADARSLALHREVVERLALDPALIGRARDRVRRWIEDGSVPKPYARAWADLLELPFDDLRAAMLDEGERSRALRQVTPFAGFVDPRTRWRIWRETRARVEAGR
jgi:hypothetical protein